MSIKEDVLRINKNFESQSISDILSLLDKIKESFQSKVTKEYLTSKITQIKNTENESEKKSLCNKLKPYFDWYLQGQ